MEFLDTGIVEEYEYDENGFRHKKYVICHHLTKYINDEKESVKS